MLWGSVVIIMLSTQGSLADEKIGFATNASGGNSGGQNELAKQKSGTRLSHS